MIDTQSMLELLPTLYRLRDADQGGPLEALIQVLAEQADIVDADIESLYDDWFIETCEPWLIPYIGDLLAVRPVYPIPGAVSQRSYVANTIRYRRRKGTASVLEQLAMDVTGWPAKATEFFQLLETTQYLNHLRPGNLRTPDLRNSDALDRLGGAFEEAAHTAEVRRIAPRHGRYDIPNVGLFVWRLSGYPLGLDDLDDGMQATGRASARRAGDIFSFNPLGLDAPLFNDPSRERDLATRVEEEDVPAILRRRALFDELEGLRRASVGWPALEPRFFTDRRRQVRVWTQATAGAPFAEIPPIRMLVADLSLGQQPPAFKHYERPGENILPPLPRAIDVAVDPKLGRLTFPPGATPNAVEVGYAYGYPADLGGGPYERRSDLLPAFVDIKNPPDAVFGIGRDTTLAPGTNFGTLGLALQAWNALPDGATAVIVVYDSRTYAESLTGAFAVKLPAGSSLLIVAGERPSRAPDAFTASGVRPHLQGDIEVLGTATAGDPPGHLQIDGLLIEGSVTLKAGNLGLLRLSNCTIAPRSAGDAPGPSPRRLVVEASPPVTDLVEARRVELVRSIVGPVSLADERYALDAQISIIDSTGAAAAIDAGQTAVSTIGCTVIGALTAKTLEAENSIFTEIVAVARTQTGCMRFCFVPADPACRTPRRYRCQPELALRDVTGAAAIAAITDRIRPAFTANAYGDPAYVQLDLRCAVEIRTGADNGSEMGVFSTVMQPQREANLGVALGEYLPVGLEGGWFYVT